MDTSTPRPPAPEPPPPDVDEAGVDLTVIRWFLELTPEGRLAHVEGILRTARAIWEQNNVRPVP